jgi:hypothetical protein
MNADIPSLPPRSAIRLGCITLIGSILAGGAWAQIVPTDFFVGSINESWEAFPAGPVVGASLQIMQGHAALSGNGIVVYEPSAGIEFPVGDVNAGVAGGTKGLGVDGSIQIEFDPPISSFGGYWAFAPDPESATSLSFVDTAGSFIGVASLTQENTQGTLQWHGWRSLRPIQRVFIGGPSFAVDRLQARVFESPPPIRPITYKLVAGSTITKYDAEQPAGPAEPLTGSFDWLQVLAQESAFSYDTIRLDWRSPTLEFRISPQRGIGSAVFFGGTANFGTVVETPAYPAGALEVLGSSVGAYTGTPDYPRSLEYSELLIFPVNGSTFARVRLIAVAVDTDGDGVPDEQDECPDTSLLGDVVDAHGCSLEQLVPCVGPVTGGAWKNHTQYVVAFTKAAEAFRRAGLITREQKRDLVRAAAASDCGNF